MPRVSQDHLDARRRQILDASRQCFARYGYEGATVRRLEDATGLSRGAIFHHFRDKEALFLALAEEESRRMADVVAEQGLVQVMRDLLAHPHEQDWLATRLEVARRLRTDAEFGRRLDQHSSGLASATVERLERRRAAGVVRDDLPAPVVAAYLELVLDGLVSHLAMGLPTQHLAAVLDLVEESVRTPGPRGAREARGGGGDA